MSEDDPKRKTPASVNEDGNQQQKKTKYREQPL